MSVCQAKTRDGKSCAVPVSPEVEFCHFHDPNRAEENVDQRREAAKSGIPINLALKTPSDLKSLSRFLGKCVKLAAEGKLFPNRAQAVSQLAKIQFDILKELKKSEKALSEIDMAEIPEADLNKYIHELKAV